MMREVAGSKPSGHVSCDFYARNGATCDGLVRAFRDFFLLFFRLDLRILENRFCRDSCTNLENRPYKWLICRDLCVGVVGPTACTNGLDSGAALTNPLYSMLLKII